ncbi:hypothetical protein Sjap_007042 [Stephania japonica]|uniref:Pectinesterase n=1 Tax=Stephania japonica TaxID=461633 RepID=A0AAP0K8U1_9MAGN
MKVKIVVVGISLILVVGVIIGVIVTVNRGGHSDNGVLPAKDTLSTGMKAVTAICSPTDYKEACINSLSPIAKQNSSVSTKDLFKAVFDVTIEGVKKAMEKSGTLGKGLTNSTQKMALEDCQELLQYAIHELEASVSSVGDSELHTVNDRTEELKSWLSAVISYQQTCIDGLDQPELKSALMDQGLLNATQFTSNVLAIVTEISAILNTFDIGTNLKSNSRRLLETRGVDEEGFPSWFSASDRRLLASNQRNNMVKPNAVVAKDGSGQYKTISAALEAYPKNHRGRYAIYVKAGVYDEYITVTKEQVNVYMYGDGPRKTIITGRKSNRDGYSTFRTATFSAIGNGFIARSIGFSNRAGPEGHQAVALRVQSDASAFYNCRMDGYQDTLYVHANRQFYRNCVISGTVDFIFGDSNTLIQNSLIIVRKPMDSQQNTITAQGRADRRETTGIVIQNCRIVPEAKLFQLRFKIPTYLGRPWKEFSRTVIMESLLSDVIQPDGWLPWAGNFALDTLYYAEYGNRGPGARTNKRVNWKGYKVINRAEAQKFTAAPFLLGSKWLRYTGAPYFLGLKR